jgi:hypothetical protein
MKITTGTPSNCSVKCEVENNEHYGVGTSTVSFSNAKISFGSGSYLTYEKVWIRPLIFTLHNANDFKGLFMAF